MRTGWVGVVVVVKMVRVGGKTAVVVEVARAEMLIRMCNNGLDILYPNLFGTNRGTPPSTKYSTDWNRM